MPLTLTPDSWRQEALRRLGVPLALVGEPETEIKAEAARKGQNPSWWWGIRWGKTDHGQKIIGQRLI